MYFFRSLHNFWTEWWAFAAAA